MKLEQLEFLTSYGDVSQLPPSQGVEIAFAGRSNVGKSSLINKLANRKDLARVSAEPGKTRTINFYRSEQLFLADLPGYGYAKASRSEQKKWSELIEHYFLSGRDIRHVFSLIDMRHPPTENDCLMLDFLKETNLPFTIIFTKADKLNRSERQQRLAGLEMEIEKWQHAGKIYFSSQTGEGLEEMKQMINQIYNN